jgi:hypothetical protein
MKRELELALYWLALSLLHTLKQLLGGFFWIIDWWNDF